MTDVPMWEKYPLLNTMTKLRKARFNAAERLSKRYKWQSVSLVLFSIYVLGLSIVPKYLKISEDVDNVIGFVTAISSVFVVALSVYSAFSEDVVRAKYLHDNAKQVTNIYNEYKLLLDAHEKQGRPLPDAIEYDRRYRIVMDACPYNHDTIDYESIRSQLETLSGWEQAWIATKTTLSSYFWPIVAIVGPPILIAVGVYFFVA